MIEAYTDGATRGNGRENCRGSWAYVIYSNGEEIANGGAVASPTTNNIMEMTAVLEALKWLWANGYTEGTVFTDSQYVCNGINDWVHGWKKRNWRTSLGESVKNKDLWIELSEEYERTATVVSWVKGHHESGGNILVDLMCNELLDGKKPQRLKRAPCRTWDDIENILEEEFGKDLSRPVLDLVTTLKKYVKPL